MQQVAEYGVRPASVQGVSDALEAQHTSSCLSLPVAACCAVQLYLYQMLSGIAYCHARR